MCFMFIHDIQKFTGALTRGDNSYIHVRSWLLAEACSLEAHVGTAAHGSCRHSPLL